MILTRFVLLVVLVLGLLPTGTLAAKLDEVAYPRGPEYGLAKDQWAAFPLPLALYEDDASLGLGAQLKERAFAHHGFNITASIIFLCAIIHTFIAGVFKDMAHHHEDRHRERIEREKRRGEDKPQVNARDDVSFRARAFHFLGEVEAVFGIWVIALAGAAVYFFGIREHGLLEGLGVGVTEVKRYLGHDVNYTEPLFVIVIMAVAATRPIIRFAEHTVNRFAMIFGGGAAAWWFAALTLTPLLGSFITEPAAMTIAALLLAKKYFEFRPGPTFAYATLGLLFVNISVGGTLTHFAAPPVLMVAKTWDWGTGFMMANYGWKAVIGILVANVLYFVAFRNEFRKLAKPHEAHDMHLPMRWEEREDPIPAWVTLVHLGFLGWTVFTNHYPPLFIGGFLFLVGFTEATGHHQNDVKMRLPLLVGFFLAGLVIHGRCQSWWISLLLDTIENDWIAMIGATVLTAFNDNAAITYLASQAPGLSDSTKYAVVAGAVTGGGLTVIANAPNPAGQSLLNRFFEGGVSPAKLVVAAVVPTVIMGAAFMLLPSKGMGHGGDAAPHAEVRLHSGTPGPATTMLAAPGSDIPRSPESAARRRRSNPNPTSGRVHRPD
ncbi:MAG: hypothetical protein HKN82_09890 [Akkermansiaceae bacterium]|nr:hypothetical protein [Akkermansiaceae bacterium]NNM30061.1 hypothetical protein [Akkermansiaceae bacterium]